MDTSQIGVVVITVGAADDAGGQLAKRLLADNHYPIVTHKTVKDSSRQVKGELAIVTQNPECKAIVLSGGTDFLLRETAYDTVSHMLTKRLNGFGELFRALAYQEIGSPAVSLQAVAGIYQRRLLFALPSDPAAVRLAMDKLILPELPDLIRQINRIG